MQKKFFIFISFYIFNANAMQVNKNHELPLQIDSSDAMQLEHYKLSLQIDLIDAVKSNNLEKITSLLNNKAGVNYESGSYKSDCFDTPLMTAINSGNPNTIQLLIENKANVNHPFLYAVMLKDSKMVELLIEKKADPNSNRDLPFNHPLLFCNNVEVAEVLIKNGSNLKLKNSYGHSAILLSAVTKGNLDLLKFFLPHFTSKEIKKTFESIGTTYKTGEIDKKENKAYEKLNKAYEKLTLVDKEENKVTVNQKNPNSSSSFTQIKFGNTHLFSERSENWSAN